jgi:FXSXX-COOH protein
MAVEFLASCTSVIRHIPAYAIYCLLPPAEQAFEPPYTERAAAFQYGRIAAGCYYAAGQSSLALDSGEQELITLCARMHPDRHMGFRTPHGVARERVGHEGERMGDEGTDLGTGLIDLSGVSLDDAARLSSEVLRESLRRVLGGGVHQPQDVAEFNSSA